MSRCRYAPGASRPCRQSHSGCGHVAVFSEKMSPLAIRPRTMPALSPYNESGGIHAGRHLEPPCCTLRHNQRTIVRNIFAEGLGNAPAISSSALSARLACSAAVPFSVVRFIAPVPVQESIRAYRGAYRCRLPHNLASARQRGIQPEPAKNRWKIIKGRYFLYISIIYTELLSLPVCRGETDDHISTRHYASRSTPITFFNRCCGDASCNAGVITV